MLEKFVVGTTLVVAIIFVGEVALAWAGPGGVAALLSTSVGFVGLGAYAATRWGQPVLAPMLNDEAE